MWHRKKNEPIDSRLMPEKEVFQECILFSNSHNEDAAEPNDIQHTDETNCCRRIRRFVTTFFGML
jgi:hypothetical protein